MKLSGGKAIVITYPPGNSACAKFYVGMFLFDVEETLALCVKTGKARYASLQEVKDFRAKAKHLGL